jgi:hypothetical protein
MAVDRRYYIDSGHDGVLEGPGLDTGTAGVDALVNDLRTARRIAVVLHGGLVTKQDALNSAEKLLPEFLAADVRPVFMVWHSGLLESLGNLLRDVWNEGLYDRLVKKLLQYVASKVGGELLAAGARDARGLPALPDEIATGREYKKREAMQEPFGSLRPATGVTPPSTEEVNRLRDDLQSDRRFNLEAEAAAAYIQETEEGPAAAAARSATTGVPPKRTLADPELFLEPVKPGETGATRRAAGPFSLWKLIAAAVKVFGRAVWRFVYGRDHGVYATVVEEVLREYYFANLGAAVWGTMKRQTSETFADPGDGPARAGRYFLERLAPLLRGANAPEFSVLGHSAGGIYACHLLRHLHEQRGKSLPANFAAKHLLLMAPACSYSLFDEVCALDPLPFQSFRLFALKDELESGYWEVPVLYPRSLLYLVSGAFEKEADGEASASDLPLLGMERYSTRTRAYTSADIRRIRTFLGASGPARQVWSVSNGGLGLMADSRKHGEFFLAAGQPTQALASALHVLKNGA